MGLVAAGVVLGCGGNNLASKVAKAPDLELAGHEACEEGKTPPASPFVVEWDAAKRGSLEAHMARGVVPIRYRGCDIQVLTQCVVQSPYQFAPTSPKRDAVRIRDADELFAKLPVGAVRLSSRLARSGALEIDMTTVGRFEAPRRTFSESELVGSCAGATHVLTAASVGAYSLGTSADAEVSAGAEVAPAGASAVEAGGRSTASRETLSVDGDRSACRGITETSFFPPDGCSAVLQIDAAPITCAEGRRYENGVGCVDARQGIAVKQKAEDYRFGGLGIGPAVEPWYRRFGEPCDDIAHGSLFGLIYASKCRRGDSDPNIGDDTVVLPVIDESKMGRDDEDEDAPVVALAWFGGAFYNTDSNFPLQYGAPAESAAAALGPRVAAEDLEREERGETRRIRIERYAGDVMVFVENGKLVGFALGEAFGGELKDELVELFVRAEVVWSKR